MRASGAAPARDDISEPRLYRDELVVPRVEGKRSASSLPSACSAVAGMKPVSGSITSM